MPTIHRLGPLFAGTLLAPALLGAWGCVVKVDSSDFKIREEKRFPVEGVTDVRLATFDGPITIRGWDREEVYVEIEKRGRDRDEVQGIEVVVDRSGSQISVEARQPTAKTYGFGAVTTWSREARIVASVPTSSNIVVRTGDGALNVERLSGRLELRTSDGNITGLDLKGDVYAHSDEGAIRLEGIDGRCDVVTSDGNVTLQGRLDALRARTGDGSVVAKLLPGSDPRAEWSLSTGDGPIVLYVPDGLGADVDAETGRGTVKLDPALALASSTDMPRGVFRGTLANGGRLVRLRTREGSITLKRLPGKPTPPPELALER